MNLTFQFLHLVILYSLLSGKKIYPGATNPEYVVSADDVDKLIAVECIPMDYLGHQVHTCNNGYLYHSNQFSSSKSHAYSFQFCEELIQAIVSDRSYLFFKGNQNLKLNMVFRILKIAFCILVLGCT